MVRSLFWRIPEIVVLYFKCWSVRAAFPLGQAFSLQYAGALAKLSLAAVRLLLENTVLHYFSPPPPSG